MPPSIELGFTSSLRETLTLSRYKLDEWVEHEKAKADAQAESYRQAQTEQQQSVDRAVTHLLALQLEGGLTVSEDDRTSEKNAVVKQTHAVQVEIADFEQEFEERTAHVQGECHLFLVLSSIVHSTAPVDVSHTLRLAVVTF
jgi:hypothetical protein